MKKLFVFLLLGVFMISFSSAAEFDNAISNYNQEEEIITFSNGCLFDIGWMCLGGEIGSVQLKTPKDFKVAAGYNYVWEMDVWVEDDYNDFLKGFEFEDWGNGKEKINRDIDIKILSYEDVEVDDYESVLVGTSPNGTAIYEYQIVGSHIENQEVWTKVSPADLKKADGKVTLRGYTNVQIGDYIDWSPLIFGVRVSHDIWASWTEDLNVGLVSYYKLDETSGVVVDSIGVNDGTVTGATRGAIGKIGNAFEYTSVSNIINMPSALRDTGTVTWTGWIKTTDSTDSRKFITDSSDGAQGKWLHLKSNKLGLTMYDSGFLCGGNEVFLSTTSINNGSWFNYAVGLWGDRCIIYINGVLEGNVSAGSTSTRAATGTFNIGGYSPFNISYKESVIGLHDEIAFYNRSLTSAEITQLYNDGNGITYTESGISVFLNDPKNNTIQNNPTVDFNWTITPIEINITNWTLNVWYENGTLAHQHINTTINTNETTTVIHNDTLLLDESYIWNVESCDTDGVDDTCDLSANWTFTLDTAPPEVNITYPPEGFIVTTPLQNVTLNYTVEHPVGNLSNCFYNTTSNSTPTNISCTTNTTSFLYPAANPDNLTIYVYANDTAANLGSDNVTIYKDAVSPTMDIESPSGLLEFGVVGSSETLNMTSTDTNLDTCWYNYNGTNVTIEGCLTGVKNSTEFILETNNMNITVYANDSLGNENSSFSEWSYEVFEINQTFSNITFETAEEEFIMWIEFDGTLWNSVDGKLNYNGTNYSSLLGGGGNIISFTSNIQIPAIETTEENLSFYWIVSLSNATTSLDVSTDSENQTVVEVLLSICSVDETPYVRFNTVDAENPFPALNATFKSAWDIGSANSTNQLLDFSYEDVTELNDTWEFCINPSTQNYTISVDVEADATNFSKNFYYISSADYIANQTSNITLYLLEDDLSTPTTLLVRDNYQRPISDATIFVQFYDTGTDTFYTVTMGKTNQNGEDIVYLNWYDSLYKFVVVQNGSTTLSTDPYKIGETPQIFQIEEDIIYDFDKFRDFEYSLFFNNETNNFVLTYVKPSALVESGCLRVIKREATSDTEICETCSTSASATLYCNIASSGNGTFIATFYATGSLAVIEWITEEIGFGMAETIFNLLDKDDAAFYTILMSTLVLLIFLVSPIFGILGILAGLLLSSSLGFSLISYGTFLFISCVGGAIIWILKR